MNKPTILQSTELAAMLSASKSCELIDVRSAEDFERSHIPGAVNNCVYEVAFLERMRACAPDLRRSVCLYGHSESTHEARMAAEKLCRSNYAQVLELREGLDGWIAAGHSVETGGPSHLPVPEIHGTRTINLAESRVEWTGRNLLNRHWGEVKISSGVLQFDHGTLTGGEFSINMNSITCADLRGNPLHDVLIAHLESDDFFDTKLYPEARFVITEAAMKVGAAWGALNMAIHGNLTIKGTALPLSFEAVAGWDNEGHAAAQAVLSFDRTLWTVIYGSGKFFRNLGGHLVNDLIEIQVRIVTN